MMNEACQEKRIAELGGDWPITREQLLAILEEKALLEEGLAAEFGETRNQPRPSHNIANIVDGFYVCECGKRGGPVKPGDPPLEKLRSVL